jgi:hypothetical protein
MVAQNRHRAQHEYDYDRDRMDEFNMFDSLVLLGVG